MSKPDTPTETQTTQIVHQELPEEIGPFFNRLMTRGEIESIQPYRPYPGQMLAQFSPYEEMAHHGIESLYTSGTDPAYQYARDMTALAGDYITNLPTWSEETAQQYMDPYVSEVIDMAQEEAQQAGEQRMRREIDEMAMAGGAGGSRLAVLQAQRESDIENQKSDIETAGKAASYKSAQEQFERERTAQITAAEKLMSSGREAAGLAAAEYQNAVATLTMMAQAGASQRELHQAGLDIARRQWVAARDFARQQIAFQAGLLRGVPAPQMDTTVMGQPGSSMGQSIGAGLGALGLVKDLFG